MVRSIYQQMLYLDPGVYEWAKIKARTLVIGGEKDGQDFPTLARHIADNIPGSEVVILPTPGHGAHLEVPDLFYPSLLKFCGDPGHSEKYAIKSPKVEMSRNPARPAHRPRPPKRQRPPFQSPYRNVPPPKGRPRMNISRV